ncbi:MAG: hypothetical protein EBT20_11370 [Alphaproteobacteria bacterium]|nr:hypothetical protein [Alphaproteobacteria bacterium]
MKLTLYAAFIIFLAGCAPNIPSKLSELFEPTKQSDDASVNKIETGTSIQTQGPNFKHKLLKHVTALPSLQAAAYRVDVANLELDLIDIGLGPNLTLSSDIGARKDNTASEFGGLASVQGSKVFYDAGRADLQKSIGSNSVEAAKVNYIRVINTALYELIRSQEDKEYAEELSKHLASKQLEYEDNRSLINMAAQNGVITSLDLLTLNEKLIGLEKREIDIRRIRNSVAITNEKYQISDPNLVQFKLDYSQILDTLETWEGNVNLKGLMIELNSAKLQVDFEKLANNTSADLAMRVSQEASSGSVPEIFAGVQITLPMYDNGKMDKRVEMAEKNVSVLKNEVDRYKIDVSSELKLWEEEIETHAQKLMSIQNEINNANDKVVELNKMLTAGKTSLMDIVNEKLNLASLETSKIDAVHAFRVTTLELLNSQTALCIAISACNEISLSSL